jgi:hypothetical protein
VVREPKLERRGGFGQGQAMYGDRLCVAARGREATRDTETPGCVYVFERQVDGTWERTATLTAQQTNGGDQFGASVSLWRDLAVVGAPVQGESDRAGAAYIFERQPDGNWREIAKLRGNDPQHDRGFGDSVSICGEQVCVGADCLESGVAVEDCGAAYLFRRQVDGEWKQVAKLFGGDAGSDASFGAPVSLSGNSLCVGASGTPWKDRAGAAFVYEDAGDGNWRQTAKLVGDNESETTIDFAQSVSLHQSHLLVSSLVKSKDAEFSVQGYLFERTGEGAWRLVCKLSPEVPRPLSPIMPSAQIFGDRACLGVNYLAVDAAEGDGIGGCAVVYERGDDGQWRELKRLNSATAGKGIAFGIWMSMSDRYIGVSAVKLDDEDVAAVEIFER